MDYDPRAGFALDPAFLARYDGRQPAWGPLDSDGRTASPIGLVTFLRTYPATLPDGSLESPAQTFARCVETVMATLRRQTLDADGHWSDEKAQREGQEMFRRMWALKVLPGGRSLANLGRESLRVKGAVQLNNCSFWSTNRLSVDPVYPFCAAMDYLMLGSGVGFDVDGAGHCYITAPAEGDDVHAVPDTREGWINALARVIAAFDGARTGDRRVTLPARWDFSAIRPKGTPLRTFGGTASGFGPLRDLLSAVTAILRRGIGGAYTTTTVVDVMNCVGRCVVAGGVRRSSEIALGNDEPEFLGLKDPADERRLMAAQIALEGEIAAVRTIDVALASVIASQEGLSVLSEEWGALQDRVDALRRDRAAILYADPRWSALDAEINATPNRMWRWASNNSVRATPGGDYRDIGERIALKGEPGLVWPYNVRRFGRVADGDLEAPRAVSASHIPGLRPDTAIGVNPCQPAEALVLTPDGIRTFADIEVGSLVWSGSRWTRVVRKVGTGEKPVSRYRTSAGSFLGTKDHRVVERGVKVRVADADGIDRNLGPTPPVTPLDPQHVMDGLLLGDGGWHGASARNFLYQGADDGCYDASEVSHLLGDRLVYGEKVLRRVTSTLGPLPRTYEREIPAAYLFGKPAKVRGFLRGLYAANGSVCGSRVTLKATSRAVVDGVQAMLSSIGIGSYVTTNAAHTVEFGNGVYECRVSYDVNVAHGKGRRDFARLVGFMHPSKEERLAALLGGDGAPKVTFDVTTVEPIGVMPVFDITVEAVEHTYWSAGLLVSNCGEISLESGELCNLVETFPTRHADADDWIVSLKYAYMIAKAVSCLPTHNAISAEVIARNRRLGVSITGVAGWYARDGRAAVLRAMDRGYRELRRLDRLYSGWLGVPESIRLTTIKPSGTLSLLAGVEGGMRFPEASHLVRIIRFHDTSPLLGPLASAGYRIEDDRYAPNTLAVYFPHRDYDVGRSVTDVSIWEQAQMQADCQTWWSDNGVSATWSFRDDEAAHLPAVLSAFDRTLKGATAYPHRPGAYVQPPYLPITAAEHAALSARIRPLDLDAFGGARARDSEEKFCDGGTCAIG